MKTTIILAALLFMCGCPSGGPASKTAGVPDAQVATASQGPEKICQWLAAEGLISTATEPEVDVVVIEPRAPRGPDRGYDDRRSNERPGRDRWTPSQSVYVGFRGSCADVENDMTVYVDGAQSNYANSNRGNDKFSYELSFNQDLVIENSRRTVNGLRSAFSRNLNVAQVGLQLSPGTLQVELSGPGTYRTSNSVRRSLDFRSTIVINTRMQSFQVLGEVPNEVYGSIRSIGRP